MQCNKIEASLFLLLEKTYRIQRFTDLENAFPNSLETLDGALSDLSDAFDGTFTNLLEAFDSALSKL